MQKRTRPDSQDELWKLTEHITRFVNVAFGRRLRPSRSLYDAVKAAFESGYTNEEMRLAFWVARCLVGDQWIKEVLAHDMTPELVLRHKGGINSRTGIPAKRWLDEMLARAGETNPTIVEAVVKNLPDDMRDGEVSLLNTMEVNAGVYSARDEAADVRS